MDRRTWIKMCGITQLQDALDAVAAGADALGFVLTPSPRRISPEKAREIVRKLPPHVMRFGVFVNESAAEILRSAEAAGVDRVQLHADPDPLIRDHYGPRILRAFRARDEHVLDAIREAAEPMFLIDAWSADVPGGAGRTFDWSLARRARDLGRMVLAGGLHSNNVNDAIVEARPFGVDVSSGIEEEPGRKSAERMQSFVRAVRDADFSLASARTQSTGRP